MGDFGEQAEAGFAGLKIELEAAAFGFEDLDDVEDQHGNGDEELQLEAADGNGRVEAEHDGAVVVGGEKASDDGDEQESQCGACETKARTEDQQGGQDDVKQWVLGLPEDDEAGGTEDGEERGDFRPGAIGKVDSLVKREVKRGYDGDPERIGGEPVLEGVQPRQGEDAGEREGGQEGRDGRGDDDSVEEQMQELPALGEIGVGADGLVEKNRGDEDFEHVAGGDVKRERSEVAYLKVIEGEVDAEVDDVAEGEVPGPLSSGDAEQDAEEETIGGPHDSDSAGVPTVCVEQRGGGGEDAQDQPHLGQLAGDCQVAGFICRYRGGLRHRSCLNRSNPTDIRAVGSMQRLNQQQKMY